MITTIYDETLTAVGPFPMICVYSDDEHSSRRAFFGGRKNDIRILTTALRKSANMHGYCMAAARPSS